jgi:hypothetical protein
MSNAQRRIFIALAAMLAPTISCYAQGLDQRLIGAWTPSASDCEKVFEKRGGQWRFRTPVDQFSSAFIIGPQRIIASGGQCRIEKIFQKANVTTLHMDCNNSIGYAPQTSTFTIKSNTEISYDATGNDTMMTVGYQKCPF